jgi:hypothetical protein
MEQNKPDKPNKRVLRHKLEEHHGKHQEALFNNPFCPFDNGWDVFKDGEYG